MSTPTNDVREIFSRIECGICGVSEAAVLKGLVEALVWKEKPSPGAEEMFVYEVCRHCGSIRGEDHNKGCVAREVE